MRDYINALAKSPLRDMDRMPKAYKETNTPIENVKQDQVGK